MDTVTKVSRPDFDAEWYDFGGENLVVPTTDAEGNKLDGLGLGEGPNMAALHCIKNGQYYYNIITGTFTNEDLPSMFKEYAPAFTAEVKAMTQEKTQQ